MSRRYYTAFLYREDGGGFSVIFPDLPGCQTCGDDAAEAVRRAEDAAAGWIEETAEHGDPVPDARPIDKIASDPELGPETARVLVPVDVPGRAMRLNISMDEGLVQRIDRSASQLGMTRSGLLAEAARRFLAERNAA